MTFTIRFSSKLKLVALAMLGLLGLAACDATSTIDVQHPTDDMTTEEKAHAEMVVAGSVTADTCLGCHNSATYGNVSPSYNVPKVWGQQAGFVDYVFAQYAQEKRPHATMVAQANTLDEQERKNIAAFFAEHGHDVTAEDYKSLLDAENQAVMGEEVQAKIQAWKDAVAIQATIYDLIEEQNGRSAKLKVAERLASEVKKPALTGAQLYVAGTCDTCHGAGGMAQFKLDGDAVVAAGEENPVLAGQYKSYLIYALKQYRDDPLNMQDGTRQHNIMRTNATQLSIEEIELIAEYLAGNASSLAAQAQ